MIDTHNQGLVVDRRSYWLTIGAAGHKDELKDLHNNFQFFSTIIDLERELRI